MQAKSQAHLEVTQLDTTGLKMPPSEVKSSLTETRDEEGELRYALAIDPVVVTPTCPAPCVWLCVPGVPGSERDFRHLAPYLAQSGTVARLTLPGFGLLVDEEEPPYTTQGRARYIERVIRSEGWTQVRLVGHSMGGPACLLVASRVACVVGLGLVSSVGLRRHRAMRLGPWGARLLSATLMSPGLGAWLHQRGRARLTRAGFRGHPLHRAQLHLIVKHVIGIDFKELASCAEALPTSVPTLCVWSARDPLIEGAISEELAAAISHAQVARLAAGGHNPQKYLAGELAELLMSALGGGGSSFEGQGLSS